MKITTHNYEAFLLDYFEGNLSAEETVALMLFIEKHPELNIELNEFDFISIDKTDKEIFENKDSLKRKEFIINDDVIESLIISLVNGDLNEEEKNKLLNVIAADENYKKLYAQYQKTKLESKNEKLEDKVLLKGHLPITSENIEYFIIADLENQLNANEKSALENYIVSFPGIKKEIAAYQALKLNKEDKVVFGNKSSLKKKEGVVISFTVFARYTTIAAAACLILYFAFFNSNDNVALNVDFVTAMQFEKENLPSENLVAEKNNSEILEEVLEENKITPQPINISNREVALQHSPNKNSNTSIKTPKEPVIDNGNEEKLIKEVNENPELYAREEIKLEPKENNNDPAFAINKNVKSINEDDFISPGQYVRNWAKKTFFTEQADEKYNAESSNLADNSLQLKGTDLTIKNKTDKDYKEYGFSLGKFSFSRKVRK